MRRQRAKETISSSHGGPECQPNRFKPSSFAPRQCLACALKCISDSGLDEGAKVPLRVGCTKNLADPSDVANPRAEREGDWPEQECVTSRAREMKRDKPTVQGRLRGQRAVHATEVKDFVSEADFGTHPQSLRRLAEKEKSKPSGDAEIR